MKDKLYRFMYGRYGTDKLNNILIYGAIVLLLIDIFLQNWILNIVALAMWLFGVFRMFSRQVYKRQAENTKFLKMVRPVTSWFSLIKKQMKDKSNRYYRCPKCKQVVRVPKGKGQITITCPSCKTKFDKRS